MRYTRIGIISLCVLLVFVTIGFFIYHTTQSVNLASISRSSNPTLTPAVPWVTLASPNDGVGDNELSSIARVDAKNAWAAGFAQNHSTGIYATLIEHWNGASWSLIASPNAGDGNNYLAGIAVVDAQTAWAVGEYQDTAADSDQALIERWDGTSWAVVPGPNITKESKFLLGIAVVNATDVWAVGKVQNGAASAPQTLIEHWDGTSWAVVPSLNPGALNNQLFGIAAVNASDIWAVGEFRNSSAKGNETLVEHWDGTSWSVIPSPNPGNVNDVLAAISVVDAQDIWVDGYYKSGASSETLIEHWNGRSWVAISGHNPGDGDNELYAIDAVNANDVWTVGNYLTGSSNLQTLIEHWDGYAWSLETTPNPGDGDNTLDGIVLMDVHHALAVGEYHQSASFQTLILQRGF